MNFIIVFKASPPQYVVENESTTYCGGETLNTYYEIH